MKASGHLGGTGVTTRHRGLRICERRRFIGSKNTIILRQETLWACQAEGLGTDGEMAAVTNPLMGRACPVRSGPARLTHWGVRETRCICKGYEHIQPNHMISKYLVFMNSTTRVRVCCWSRLISASHIRVGDQSTASWCSALMLAACLFFETLAFNCKTRRSHCSRQLRALLKISMAASRAFPITTLARMLRSLLRTVRGLTHALPPVFEERSILHCSVLYAHLSIKKLYEWQQYQREHYYLTPVCGQRIVHIVQ